MYICRYMHTQHTRTYIYIYRYTHMHAHIHVCIDMCIYIHIYTSIHLCIHPYIRQNIYTSMHLYVDLYICLYICAYSYTNNTDMGLYTRAYIVLCGTPHPQRSTKFNDIRDIVGYFRPHGNLPCIIRIILASFLIQEICPESSRNQFRIIFDSGICPESSESFWNHF